MLALPAVLVSFPGVLDNPKWYFYLYPIDQLPDNIENITSGVPEQKVADKTAGEFSLTSIFIFLTDLVSQ